MDKKNAFGMTSRSSELEATPLARKQVMDIRKKLLNDHAEDLIGRAIKKALDDGDKDQGMMLKMLMDRMLPMSEFEARKDGSRSQVTITISGVGDTKVAGETIDAEEV